MSYCEEFHTVDLILSSTAETRGVDAFALSLIKVERQIRRLVTHLVFQFPSFNRNDIPGLRGTLENNKQIYFAGFVRGFNTLYSRSIKDIIGADYDLLHVRIGEAIDFRNKIFHGQLTSKQLSREDLLSYVVDIRLWAQALANGASIEFQYDGFSRNSFQKSSIVDLAQSYKLQINDLAAYAQFIKHHMERP